MTRGRVFCCVWPNLIGSLVGSLVGACGPTAAPSAAPVGQALPSASEQARGGVEPPAAAPQAPAKAEGSSDATGAAQRFPIRFESVATPAVNQAPRVEIQFPILGKQITLEQALAYQVKLKTESWLPELGLLVQLDDYPPKRFDAPNAPVRLSDLIPANRELEPGAHRLYAFARRDDGTTVHPREPQSRGPVAFVPFWVGPDPEQQSAIAMQAFETPMLVIVSPRGTFNGERAADAVILDFHVLGRVAGTKVKAGLQVLSSGDPYETLLEDARPLKILGLPSGDHKLTLSLLDADGRELGLPYASASVTITVNRDAPVQ